MAISHRTNRLKIKGSPSVEKLQNDRYKLTITCSALNSREDWYSANKARIFPDFGSLESAEMSIDGLAPRTGEAYADMRLVSVQSGNRSPRDGSDYIVVLTYETLGATFVQVKDDTIDLELNGLRRVTRTSIAQAGTDIPDDDKDVGVDFIDHQIDAETAVRCFLASYQVDDNDSYREFERTYIQAGTLSVSTKNLSEGVKQVTTVFLVTEGTTVGPVTSRSTNNFQGLKTITVTTMQDKDGNPLGTAGTTPVHSFDTFSNFSYPGLFVITQDSGSGSGFNYLSVGLNLTKAPAQSKVQSKVYVFFTTTSTILPSDYKYESASGLWSPNDWGSFSLFASGSSSGRQFNTSKSLRGYRTTSSDNTRSISGGGTEAFYFQQSQKIEDTTAVSYQLTVNKGPSDPVGSKWVLDVKITTAFDDVDGTTYYKKTIIVTDTIPAQVSEVGGPYN